MTNQTATPEQIAGRKANGQNVELIDVRTRAEFVTSHARGAISIPLDELNPRTVMATRAVDEPLFILCQSGGRATRAVELFNKAGFSNAVCVEGGTTAWERAGLPIERGHRNSVSL